MEHGKTQQYLVYHTQLIMMQIVMTVDICRAPAGALQISQLGQSTGLATFRGDGEHIMKIRRFVPDFLSQTGNTQVTLQLRNYPNDSQASSALGPFTISSSTSKVDTRARARAVSLKIANTTTSQSWKLGTFRLDIQPDGRR